MSGYTLEDGRTLKNKLGIEDAKELEIKEASLVEVRAAEIRDGKGPEGHFDADYLKALHYHLFQDVYEWAGHTRDERVKLSDGTIATMPYMKKEEGEKFLDGRVIPTALEGLCNSLQAADCLRGLPREEFAERAADLMADLNSIHPFREGNGRTQRIFCEQLAQEAGYDLDFSVITKARMEQVSIAAHEQRDLAPMRRMFDEISTPERVEALEKTIDFFEYINSERRKGPEQERKEFDWNNIYISTMEPGHPVDVVLSNVRDDYFIARTTTDILVGKAKDLPESLPARGEEFSITGSSWTEAEHEPEREAVKESVLMVIDSATGMLETVVDFVTDFLAGGSPTPPPTAQQLNQIEQIKSERRALAAIENMRESMERGETLRAEDLQLLTPTHLENIKLRGDDYIRELVERAERSRDLHQDYGRER